jgi:hypothetical protein
LLATQEMIFNEIEYNHKLNQMTIPVTHKTIYYLRTIAATLSILVNFFMVLFYNVNVRAGHATFIAEYMEEVVLTMLSLLQLTFSTALFIVYLINRAPLALKLKDKSPGDEDQGEEEAEAQEQSQQPLDNPKPEEQQDLLSHFKEAYVKLYREIRVTGFTK